MHRLAKETVSISAAAVVGGAAAWACQRFFNTAALADLLKIGGPICGLLVGAVRYLNTASERSGELQDFDLTTRESFGATVRDLRRRLVRRSLLGVVLAAVAFVCGVLLSRAAGTPTPLHTWTGVTGGAALTAGAVILGVQIWVVSWISDYLAGAKTRLAAERKNQEKLAGYAPKEHPIERRPS